MGANKLCFLDWNGTVQDDLQHIYECGVQRIFRHYGLPCPSLDEFRNEVKPNFMESFYWPRGIPRDTTARQLNAIMSEGKAEKGVPADLFDDAPSAISALCDADWEIMVVSGYDPAELDAAIERSGLMACFSYVRGGVGDKPATMRECLASYGRTPDRLIKVGDTADDALAAGEVGAVPYICPRGFHGRDRIEAVRPRVPSLIIIESLGELPGRLDP